MNNDPVHNTPAIQDVMGCKIKLIKYLSCIYLTLRWCILYEAIPRNLPMALYKAMLADYYYTRYYTIVLDKAQFQSKLAHS